MKLNFVGRNIDITPALKAFVTEKFSPLEKRFNRIDHINVVLHVEHITQIAEATVHIDGTDLHATAKDEDMYQAIEALHDKLLSQITKHKDKLINSHR